MRDFVASELRRLHRKVAQAERRLSLADLTGKVEPGSQDMAKRTVRLRIGKRADGSPILTPPVRWEGTGAGAFKMHAVPKDNEQMSLRSPSGTIGPGSLATWGTYDDDNKPPSKSKTEAVMEFGGKAKLTFGQNSEAHELNEQLKGLAARLSQAEHNLHGLFDVTSKMRERLETVIPALKLAFAPDITPILNKLPSGLEEMANAITGKAKSYLDKALQQALAKFKLPNISDAASLIDGAVQGAIGQIEGQIAAVATANPAVSAADTLRATIADLQAGTITPAVEKRIAGLTSELASLASANPAIPTVMGLRGQLQGLLDQAAPALNFLEPQKNLVKGVTRTLKLSWS